MAAERSSWRTPRIRGQYMKVGSEDKQAALMDDGAESTDSEDLEDESEPEHGWSALHFGGHADDDNEGMGCRAALSRFVHSEGFRLAIAIVILANTICMGLQLDFDQEVRVFVFGKHIQVWMLINIVFMSIFLIEIVLRLVADGFVGFFCDQHDWAWNIFDFTVIFLGVLDHWAIWLDKHHREVPRGLHHFGNSNVVTAARALRILRVLRVLRIFRSLRKLRMLARGLLESVEVVFWIGVMVLVMLFICAIVCTQLIGQNADSFPEDEQDLIRMYWGTVPRSMFTLFQFLTMDDWWSVNDLVARQYPYMETFFFMFIFFGAFVIMSLLTGVMADHVNDVRETELQEEQRARLSQVETLAEEVSKRDVNNDGLLDRDEFRDLFEESKSTFGTELEAAGLQLKKAEAVELFEWFDVNDDNKVGQEELSHGVRHLFQGLTPLQLFKLGAAVRAAEAYADQHHDQSEKKRRTLHAPSEAAKWRLGCLASQTEDLEERLGKFEHDLRGFMDTFARKAHVGGA